MLVGLDHEKKMPIIKSMSTSKESMGIDDGDNF